jgi:STAS-like domain of unknown function (DUF4325)
MSGDFALSVFEIVGSPLSVASDDGQRVFERISEAMKEGKVVTVSFRNIKSITSAFLNAAIGQLYGTFGEDQIRSQLKVVDMQGEDLALLKRVVDTAKEYFKDPVRFRSVSQKVFGDDTNGG